MGNIYLVRHGQASFGTEDYDRLSELGLEQSRLLGAWLARRGWRIDQVVSGNLKRQRQTAEACLAAVPPALHPRSAWRIDAGFDEYDADAVMVRSRPEFADPARLRDELAQSTHPRRAFQTLFAAAMARWMSGAHDAEYGESWSDFRARCVASVRQLAVEAGAAKNVLVFTSGGPIAAICQHLLDLPHQRAFDVNAALVNGAVTGLLYQPERIGLSFLNNFAHLEHSGRADVVTYR